MNIHTTVTMTFERDYAFPDTEPAIARQNDALGMADLVSKVTDAAKWSARVKVIDVQREEKL